jgi:hypothetical protein
MVMCSLLRGNVSCSKNMGCLIERVSPFESDWPMLILVSGVNDSTLCRMTSSALAATQRRLLCNGNFARNTRYVTISDVGHTARGILSLHYACFLFSEFWSSKFQGQGRVFLEVLKGLITQQTFLWIRRLWLDHVASETPLGACFLFGLLFDPEDGGDMFLRSVDWLSPDIPEARTHRADWFTSVKNLFRFMERPEIFDWVRNENLRKCFY